MRRRRGDGLVSCGRAAPTGVKVVLARAWDAPTTATRPRGRWRRVRVRVRLRGCVREASGAVAIELQGGGGGGGVAAADLRREVTVVVSGIDGFARRGRGRGRRSRRLVLGVQRVHEVRAHRGGGGRGPREGGPGRAGGAEQAGSAPQRGCTAAGASGAAAHAAGAAGLRCCCRPPARAWPLRLGSHGRSATGRSCPAFAPAASASRRLSRGSRGLTQPPRSPPARPLPARAGSAAI